MTGTSLCSRLANGGGQEEVLMESGTNYTAGTLLSPELSPDGRYLLHIEQSGPGGGGLFALPMTGEKKSIPIVLAASPQAKIVQHRLSPDGRWLAYTSTESGREEVYVTHFPSGQGRWQISQNGGTSPAWRGDSRELWFISSDGYMHAAPVNSKSEEFESDPAKTLFQIGFITPLGNPYEIAPDGQRVIFGAFPESLPTPLVLVTNWNAELKK